MSFECIYKHKSNAHMNRIHCKKYMDLFKRTFNDITQTMSFDPFVIKNIIFY